MRKPAMIAAAVAVVLFGVAVPTAHAQQITNSKSSDFVGSVLLATADTGKDASKKEAAPKTDEQPAEAAAAETKPTPVIVTVQSGDSLSSIAAAHNTTWVRLYNANTTIADPNIINPGDQIRIPEVSEQLADRALPQPAVVATVTTQSSTATARTAAPRAVAASYPVSANAAKAFIYAHESGNNPNATNPNGCYGLGQDCNGRVRAMCGADYACQDAYFTRYAMGRYGSWEAAYAFWQSHRWW